MVTSPEGEVREGKGLGITLGRGLFYTYEFLKTYSEVFCLTFSSTLLRLLISDRFDPSSLWPYNVITWTIIPGYLPEKSHLTTLDWTQNLYNEVVFTSPS